MDWDCEFRLKRILFNGSYKRILCQNENGPCPLLAISNILILKNVLGFGTTKATIPASRIVQALANILLEQQEKLLSCTNDSHLAERRLEQLHCVIDTLPSLLGGMDVNIKFTDIDAFEFTQQLSVLDAFDLKLFHGWCIDPSEDILTYSVIQQHSYNSLVDKIVSSDPNSTSEQAECDIIRKFLKDTSSQLTYYGLIRLNDPVIHFKDNQFAIFFRNNHFSVLYKDKGRVFVLVTDEGFCTTTNSNNCNPSPYRYRGAEAPFQRDIDRQDMETVVWEHLSEVSGDNEFCNHNFQIPPKLTNSSNVVPGPHNLLVPVTPVLTSMPSSEVTCDSASIPGLESAKIKVDVVQNLPSTVSPMHTSAIADGSCSSLDEPKSVLRNNYGRANENTEQCTAGLSSELGGEHTTNVDVFAYSEAELDAMRREEAYWNSIKQSETTHHLNEVNREVVMHGDTNPWYDAPDTYYSENRRNGDPHNCILQ